jgi:hypothetical protein
MGGISADLIVLFPILLYIAHNIRKFFVDWFKPEGNTLHWSEITGFPIVAIIPFILIEGEYIEISENPLRRSYLCSLYIMYICIWHLFCSISLFYKLNQSFIFFQKYPNKPNTILCTT